MLRSQMYREQHRALRELVGAFPASVNDVGSADVRGLLIKLGGLLRAHLKMEDDRLYPLMVEHADERIRAKARAFQEEMGGLAAAFGAFYDKWLRAEASHEDPNGFFTEWSGVKGALAARMDREDNDLYVMLDELDAG